MTTASDVRRFAVCVRPNGEYQACREALVTLSPDNIKDLKGYREIFMKLKKDHGDLFEIVFFDYTPEWVDADETDEENTPSYAVLEGEDYIENERVIELADEDEPGEFVRCSCETSTLHIREQGISWKAVFKHTDTEHESDEISWSELFDE